jgi:hypothetical protein
MNMGITDLRYYGQNLAVYNCEFLWILRHRRGFVVRQLSKLKKNANIKSLCVSMFIACIGYISCGVLP